MAVFRVEAESIDYLYIDIEANSAQEAFEFADKVLDGDAFHSNGSSWRMTRDMVSELENGAAFDWSTKEKED